MVFESPEASTALTALDVSDQRLGATMLRSEELLIAARHGSHAGHTRMDPKPQFQFSWRLLGGSGDLVSSYSVDLL